MRPCHRSGGRSGRARRHSRARSRRTRPRSGRGIVAGGEAPARLDAEADARPARTGGPRRRSPGSSPVIVEVRERDPGRPGVELASGARGSPSTAAEVDRRRPGVETDVDEPDAGPVEIEPGRAGVRVELEVRDGFGRDRHLPARPGRPDPEQAAAIGRCRSRGGRPRPRSAGPRPSRAWPVTRPARRRRPSDRDVAAVEVDVDGGRTGRRGSRSASGTRVAPWIEPQAPAVAPLNPLLNRPPTMSPNVAATMSPPTNEKRVRASRSPTPSPMRIIGQSVQSSRTCESLSTPARTSRGIDPARIRKTPQPRAPRRTCMSPRYLAAMALC